MPHKGYNPRRSNSTKRNAIRTRLIARAAGLPVCHICGRPIDTTLPAGDPAAFEIDELIPVSKGGDPLDIANCAPSHRLCNQRRGNRPLNAVRRTPEGLQGSMPIRRSRAW